MPSLNLISGGEPERIRGAFAEAALFDVLGSDDHRSHGAGFEFPMKKSEFWAPLAVGERAKRRAGYWLQMVARLRRGITPSQAQTEMDVVGKQLEQQYPDENAGYGF